MTQRNLRMPDSLNDRVSAAARLGGYRSSSAFIRAAILAKLSRVTPRQTAWRNGLPRP